MVGLLVGHYENAILKELEIQPYLKVSSSFEPGLNQIGALAAGFSFFTPAPGHSWSSINRSGNLSIF